MSTSLTTLANKSLAFVRADSRLTDVTDETDGSKEAIACRTYITDVQNEILEEMDWTFAHREMTLSTHGDAAPQGWSYRYTWRPDCLVPRAVLAKGQKPNIANNDYDSILSLNGNERTIVTNVAEAYLAYTSNSLLTQVEKWPYNFREAVSMKLAANLAIDLNKTQQTHDKAFARYVQAMRMAFYVDQSGRTLRNHQDPANVRVRR